MKIEESYIQLQDEKNIYVKTWTPERVRNHSPIVLLHDSLGSVDLWKTFPSQIAEQSSQRVIAYDRLGFGRSDPRKKLPSFEFIEEEAIIFFPLFKEQLNISHYCLLGYSVGGAMAVNIASRDNDCQSLITLSAQAFVEEQTIDGLKKAQHFFNQAGQIDRLRKWHGDKATWVLQAWLDVWLSPDFAKWSLKPCIANVECPTLAIHGANDEYGSVAFPEFISQNVAGSGRMLILEECGHMPHKEKNGEVIDAIRSLLIDSI